MKSPPKLYLLLSRKAQVAINNPKLLSKKSDADAEVTRRNERNHLGADDWRAEAYVKEGSVATVVPDEPEPEEEEST
jgi:hypothetical protein